MEKEFVLEGEVDVRIAGSDLILSFHFMRVNLGTQNSRGQVVNTIRGLFRTRVPIQRAVPSELYRYNAGDITTFHH